MVKYQYKALSHIRSNMKNRSLSPKFEEKTTTKLISFPSLLEGIWWNCHLRYGLENPYRKKNQI
jgi:hypothetical protein